MWESWRGSPEIARPDGRDENGFDRMQVELQRVQNIEKNTEIRSGMRQSERECKKQDRGKEPNYALHSGNFSGIETSSRVITWSSGENWKLEIKGRRLEMPVFLEQNPNDWIFKAKRYFQVNQLTEGEILEMAALCFEVDALAWYQCEQKRRNIKNWDELKVLMRMRFRSL